MRAISIILLAGAVALLPVAGWRASAEVAPGDGIAGSEHDFSGKTATVTTIHDGEEEISTATTGACTFCHTPHKAINTLLLWNHTLSVNTFSWDAPATTAGTDFPTFGGDTYKGPTAKCLSCHDGSVAIGDIAWFNAGTPAVVDPATHGEGDKHNVGFGGAMAGNHPVAMPYPYENAQNTYNGVTTGAQAYLDEWQGTPLSPIRVFNDDGAGNISAGAVAGQTGIECSSCHDPHNKKAEGKFFLRGTLDGNTTAYICMKCHVK